MDLHEIRNRLRTSTIYDLPLRVTYYARVSSDSDEQINSLGNQITYYDNLIKKNSAWTFVPGYIDEGLSGISTKRRQAFNQMIADAKENKFDLVITKEISRFARNTLDSIKYTRELLNCDVGVFFQNDNINTFDDDSELRLSIMSSIAQDELRKLSSRIKFGHQQAIKSNVVLGNSRIFGYRKDNKKLVVEEDEAAMVRELFELYSTDKYSMKQIENIFWYKGYRNYKGKKISHTTMSGIISNPKYKGYYVANRVKVVDMFTKKQKFLPPEEWVMFKDETGELVPAIVTEELWEAANVILRRRSEDVKNRQGVCNHPNLLTGKMFCSDCGSSYYRRESKTKSGEVNSKWVCSGKLNNGATSCHSFPIYESEIKPILFEAFYDTKADAESIANEYAEMFADMLADTDLKSQIEEKKTQLEIIEKKKSKLLEYNVMGKISDRDYLSQNELCVKESEILEKEVKELEEEMLSKSEFNKRMNEIRSTLQKAQEDVASGVITKEFVNKYVDKIFVTPIDENTAKLEIKIFTGNITEKYLKKLSAKKRESDKEHGSRTGDTFKKMIEDAENNMKNK